MGTAAGGFVARRSRLATRYFAVGDGSPIVSMSEEFEEFVAGQRLTCPQRDLLLRQLRSREIDSMIVLVTPAPAEAGLLLVTLGEVLSVLHCERQMIRNEETMVHFFVQRGMTTFEITAEWVALYKKRSGWILDVMSVTDEVVLEDDSA